MSFSVIARLVRPPHPSPPLPPAALCMNVRRQQCDQICQNFATLAKFNKSLMIILRVYLANIWQNFESTLVMLMGIFLLFQMVDIDQRVLPSGHTEWSKHESARALSWLNIFAGAVLLLLLLRPMHAIKQCQAEREREREREENALSLTHSLSSCSFFLVPCLRWYSVGQHMKYWRDIYDRISNFSVYVFSLSVSGYHCSTIIAAFYHTNKVTIWANLSWGLQHRVKK